VAKAASKRPPVKTKARTSKPAPKPSVNKASSKLVKAVAKAVPFKPLPKSPVAKAPAPKAAEKPTGKSNGIAVAKNPKLGSMGSRVVRPIKSQKPVSNGEPVEAPVPSNNKPRKNQAGFNAKELEHFRDLLLAKRGEIVGDMSAMEREALRTSGGSNLSTLPIHMADMGTDNYEQEFTLGLVETERKLLREINHALAKIQNGTYGICEGTGKPITKARLEVQPWARYSIEYAKQMERGGGARF
jgi:RNA polymerase-binding protein DksA